MIIIIKKILMCLVFATQLLIMAWATTGSRAAAKMDSACRTPPTCPEVSGLAKVARTCLPPPSDEKQSDGSQHKIAADKSSNVGLSLTV